MRAVLAEMFGSHKSVTFDWRIASFPVKASHSQCRSCQMHNFTHHCQANIWRAHIECKYQPIVCKYQVQKFLDGKRFPRLCKATEKQRRNNTEPFKLRSSLVPLISLYYVCQPLSLAKKVLRTVTENRQQFRYFSRSYPLSLDQLLSRKVNQEAYLIFVTTITTAGCVKIMSQV